jgi:two-component system, LuxR family, response regulator FixJ
VIMATSIVHVIDDDDALRDSLSFLLGTARLNVKTYESAEAFLAALPDANSGCIITDVRMPDMSGVDLLRKLNELQIALPVIIITGHGDVQLAVEAMKIGAADFIEKPFDDEVLLNAVRAALDRWEDKSREISERSSYVEKLEALSSRERDVLEGLIAGKANKVIAFDLGISPRTVEIYRANVMTKTGANNLPELVRMAMLAGLFKTAVPGKG